MPPSKETEMIETVNSVLVFISILVVSFVVFFIIYNTW